MADYIKREDVIEAMYRSCDSICPYSLSERKMVCGSCTRGKVFDVIKNEIHAADVRENVRGEWIPDEEDIKYGCSLVKYYCSRCGKKAFFNRVEWKFIKSNYCPNCGADMRGEKDG